MTNTVEKKVSLRNPSRVHHGKNIEKFREILDLTQKELAEKLKVRQQQVSKWEHSEVLDEEVIKKVSDALGIDPDLIRNQTREGIINIFKVEKLDGVLNGVLYDNGTHTTNNTPIDKVSELYERLREKDKEVYQKEKELLEYKMKHLQEENEKLKNATK